MKKNGFTLIELLSVIVLLILMIGIAVINLDNSFNNGRKKSLLDEAAVYSEGALNKHATDKVNESYYNDLYADKVSGKRCYSIKSLNGKYVSKNNDKYAGSVEVCYGDSCSYKTKIWLTDGEYYVNGKISDDELSLNDISSTKNTEYFESCGVDITTLRLTYDFDYTGSEDSFIAPSDGKYIIEAWGAQGGGAYSAAWAVCGAGYNAVYNYLVGGNGGYSYTEVDLKKGEKLYINVGEEGHFANYYGSPTNNSSYNGGGKSDSTHASGGGASSVALKSGLINNLTAEDLIIVAGGGGGSYASSACNTSTGIGGGGYCSGGKCSYDVGRYGWDENSLQNGGGFYTFPNTNYGGTGYIGNRRTVNGYMYCKGCNTNTGNYTKTFSTTNVSADPISNYVKEGNGYVRIQYAPNDNTPTTGVLATDFPDYLEVEYIRSYGRQYIDTEYYPKPNSSYDVDVALYDYNSFQNNLFVFGASSTYSGIKLSTGLYTYQANWKDQFAYSFNDGPRSEIRTNYQISTGMKRNFKLNVTPNTFQIFEDGNEVYTNTQETAPTNVSNHTLYIFANNNAGTVSSISSLALYRFKIFENGTIVRDFIPCYNKSNAKIGLCDLVTKKFYGNKGTDDDFTKGPFV